VVTAWIIAQSDSRSTSNQPSPMLQSGPTFRTRMPLFCRSEWLETGGFAKKGYAKESEKGTPEKEVFKTTLLDGGPGEPRTPLPARRLGPANDVEGGRFPPAPALGTATRNGWVPSTGPPFVRRSGASSLWVPSGSGNEGRVRDIRKSFTG
jgi:hypothetical protein